MAQIKKCVKSAVQGQIHFGLVEKDSCICCKTQYAIQDILTPNILYVMLPKEKVYVKLQEWEHEYLKSQVQELIYIFRKLGAMDLSISVNHNDETSRSWGGGFEVGHMGFNVGGGVCISKGSGNADIIQTHLVYDAKQSGTAIETLEDMLNDSNVYYLSHKPGWKNIINNRIKGAKVIEFSFTHHDMIKMSKAFIVKLQSMGLSIHNCRKEVAWVRMDFKALF